jgi:hypothetical protein
MEAWRGARRVLSGTGCDAPRTAAKLTALLSAPNDIAVVAGTAAADVAAVRVRSPKGDVVRVDTVAVPSENLRRSGLTSAPRVYVAMFPQGFGDVPAAPVVEALATDGRSIAALGQPAP